MLANIKINSKIIIAFITTVVSVIMTDQTRTVKVCEKLGKQQKNRVV